MSAGGYRITHTLPPSPTEDAIGMLADERDQLRAEVERLRLQLQELQSAFHLMRVSAVPAKVQPEPYAALTPEPRRANDPRLRPDPTPPPVHGFVPAANAQQQGIDFGAVVNLTPAELDALPYGLVTLDAEGRVLHYNDTESRMVGLPKEQVIGRSFFTEVAPCARVREFEGRFRDLVRDPMGVRVQTFDFVFRFPRQEQQVTIVITPARARGQFHVAMLRRSITAR
jgi:photoactive yellow protein